MAAMDGLSFEELSTLLQDLDALPLEPLWIRDEERLGTEPPVGSKNQQLAHIPSPSSSPAPAETRGSSNSVHAGDDTERTDRQNRQSALAARRQRVYQEKKKIELSKLRATQATLVTKLNTLAARNEAFRSELQGGGQQRSELAGWRRIALRQMAQRLDAEALNRQLRVQWEKPRLELNDDDLRSFAALSNEVDTSYGQTHDVFRHHDPSLAGARSLRRWTDETNTPCVDIFESTSVPFGLRDVIGAVPRSVFRLFAQECTPVVSSLPDPEPTTAVKMIFTYDDAEQRPWPFQFVCVFKRFEEQDRVVFVWRAFTKKLDKSSRFVESGWCVAHEHPATTATETVLKHCTRIWLLYSKKTGEQHLEEYIDLMNQSEQSDAEAFAQAIEDVLVDAAVSRK